ncbi:hypothetical protein CFC21_090228 [Triticum aestivum]|uniref:PGG domain-containing protein n=2 Tax=Triticum aestivum TaxID=4565 RepID=A0A9R1LDT7_WHEAT|nr:hypothetical protein CFC21_090228 [Triticum aestivum]
MSEEAHRVAVSSGDDVLVRGSLQFQQRENTSEEAHIVEVSSGDGVMVGGPSQSQQQEITVDEGANGMSVDRRLAALVVDKVNDEWSTFRGWMLLLTSLVATVTFAAGLSPPGGFWSVDDKVHGYVAGTSIMHDKFALRYSLFQFSNTAAFFCSLMIIAILARSINTEGTTRNNCFFAFLVFFCFISLATSYIAGSWNGPSVGIYNICMFFLVLIYMLLSRIFSQNLWCGSCTKTLESMV